MVGGAYVDIEDGVAGHLPKPDPKQSAASEEEAIAQGMPTFCLPMGFFRRVGVLGPEIVIAVGPELQESLVSLLDIGKR